MNPSTICGLFFNDPDPIYLREVTVGSLTLNVYKLVIDNDVLITYINYHYGEQDKGDIASYKDGMLTGEWWGYYSSYQGIFTTHGVVFAEFGMYTVSSPN